MRQDLYAEQDYGIQHAAHVRGASSGNHDYRKVYDLMEEEAPRHESPLKVEGHLVEEQQLYYKGICKNCLEERGMTH